jgi:predicted nucleotidyltransferase
LFVLNSQSSQDPILHELAERIVRVADPERVILFGSKARGTSRPDSDYDFLVVKNVALGSRRALRREIYHALYGMGVAKDVLLTTSEDLARYGYLHGTILRPALSEGIIVYERAA